MPQAKMPDRSMASARRLTWSCVWWSSATALTASEISKAQIDFRSLPSIQLPLRSVAFGGENDHLASQQPLWSQILAHQPQLWIWMGNNVYADHAHNSWLPFRVSSREATPQDIQSAYIEQQRNEEYRIFRESVPLIGTWNDLDYGVRRGDRRYKSREWSQQVFLDFINEPPTSTRRTQHGVYKSYTFGEGEQSVKFILLDVRFNKDPYGQHHGGFLGEDQWRWLEDELTSSKAAFNFVISSIQVLPTDRLLGFGEQWGRFPRQRLRLLDLLLESQAKGVILLSGGAQFAEINQVTCDNYRNLITEITSSGLTNALGVQQDNGWLSHLSAWLFGAAKLILPWDFRPYREAFYDQVHFGEITLDWEATPMPVASVGILSEANHRVLTYNISSAFFQPTTSTSPVSSPASAASDACEAIRASSTMRGFSTARQLLFLLVAGLSVAVFPLTLLLLVLVLAMWLRKPFLDLQYRLYAYFYRYRKID